MDKNLLNGVELEIKDTKINDEYSIKRMDTAPHLNSICMLLNKDGKEGKLEGMLFA